jgi:hypothetical protein
MLIRILGSVPLTNGTGSDTGTDPALFVGDLQDAKNKFLCFFLFEGTLTSFFKDKKS